MLSRRAYLLGWTLAIGVPLALAFWAFVPSLEPNMAQFLYWPGTWYRRFAPCSDSHFSWRWLRVWARAVDRSATVSLLPNKRLKLAARADYGMNFSSARRSL